MRLSLRKRNNKRINKISKINKIINKKDLI